MVINDHDAVNASGLTVFRDVGKVTSIRLPDLAEFVLFIGLTVPEVRISCRFEIVEPDKTLHGIHTDGCREKGFLHEMLINLRGIHAWMLLLDPVDFRDGLVIEGTEIPLSDLTVGIRASSPPSLYWDFHFSSVL